MDKMTNIDYKAILKKIAQIITSNKILFTSFIVLLLGGFVLVKISSYTNPELDEAYLNQQLSTLTTVQFDDQAIVKIQELNKSNVNITSDFTTRDNPFIDN